MSEQLELYYLVCIIFHKKEHYLLWKDDLFFASDENNNLLINHSQSDLELVAKKYKLPVSNQATHTIDIDHSFRILGQMRRDRSLSENSCNILLDCLNILEDMAKTLGIHIGIQDDDENACLNRLYDKIFWGNNLPAVTPEGKSYSPLMLQDEIKIIRKYLRGLWNEIYNKVFSNI